jgi:predicted metal-binding membrane protein
MTTAGALRSRGRLGSRPAIVAEAGIAAAWLGAVVVLVPGGHSAMPGMAGAISVATVGSWLVVTAAMMLPSALPAARHVARNSLHRRRHRAVAQFVACYLAAWSAFGAVALALLGLLPATDAGVALVVVAAAAAGWQLTPMKAGALRAGHRPVPLPASGWRADTAAMRFGLHHGACCVASCWCLMVVMAWAPGPGLVWCAAVATGVFAEKTAEHPRQMARIGAVVLALIALFASLSLHLG